MVGKGVKNKTKSHSNQPFKQAPNGKNLNAKTMCKLDHIKNIAEWAALESSIPPLAAFFGQRVAATNEALGLRNDSSSFLCERCETILEPGNNCTVRIEKNKAKGRNRRKKSNNINQNSVVYKCNFCLHRNLMRGTVKGYVKEICPPKPKPKSKPVVEEVSGVSKFTPLVDGRETGTLALPIGDGKDVEMGVPATPVLLLDVNRRKRNRSSAKKGSAMSSVVDDDKGVQSSSKRRKKSWTSLKQIVESREHETVKKLSSLTIPFLI